MKNATVETEIYLIRHTAPAVEKGICYGQADIGVKDSFLSEAAIIQQFMPLTVGSIYSSPLQRCKKLAEHLFADHPIQLHDDLKEINCGQWELQLWNDIPRQEIDPWMNELITTRIPQGESYQDLYDRVTAAFLQVQNLPGPIVIVAHGGVIRSILSHLTHTALKDSFSSFSLHYGCVIKITNTPEGLRHQILSNIIHEKETHKPSYL